MDRETGKAKGVIRLYRVESVSPQALPAWLCSQFEAGAGDSRHGRWFTDRPDTLEWYRADAGMPTRTLTVDILKAEAEAYRVCNLPAHMQIGSRDTQSEYILPLEVAQWTCGKCDAPTGGWNV